jgi:hypothetical protein
LRVVIIKREIKTMDLIVNKFHPKSKTKYKLKLRIKSRHCIKDNTKVILNRSGVNNLKYNWEKERI